MAASVWVAFLLFVAVMIALDLGVFHRHAHVVRLGEAITWSGVWVALALAFTVVVFQLYEGAWFQGAAVPTDHLTGREAALQYLTGYVLEKSLSIDNIFVIAMIFAFLRVPPEQQHRLLIWGVLGAVVLRGVMIAVGAVLIRRFDWIVYVFGAVLLLSAVKMLITRHDNLEPDRNPAVRWLRRLHPITDGYRDGRFFVVENGRRHGTPLLVGLVLVETSDVMFAVDSIPAIFAVTREPFLVFTSNVFAILGLRSLYFALAGLMERFRYLKTSLVFVLAYVGVKMILSHHHPIPNGVSLSIIAGILSVGIVASLLGTHRDTAPLRPPMLDDLGRAARVTYREARRVAIVVVGTTLLVIGVAMIVLPGPAVVVIPLGLSLLAIEFAWARRWLARIAAARDRLRRIARDRVRPRRGSPDAGGGTP